jgi:hypothetical protein
MRVKTNSTPNAPTVQRRYFKWKPKVATMLLASGLSVKLKQFAGVHGSHGAKL